MSSTLVSSQNYFDAYKKLLNITNSKVQKGKIDSLIELSRSTKPVDTTIRIVHDFSLKQYRKRQYNIGVEYVLQEIDLYEKANRTDSESYLNVLYNAGLFYYKNLEYKKASFYYDRLVKMKPNSYSNNACSQLARTYGKLGDSQKAILYFLKAIKGFEKSKDYQRLTSAYINLAVTYNALGTKEAINESIRILNKADSLSKEVRVRKSTYNNLKAVMASTFLEPVNYSFQTVKKYYLDGIKTFEADGDSISLARTYNNLAFLYNIEQKDSTKYFVDKGLKYAHYPEARARLHDNLAEYQIRKGKLKEAEKSIHASLEIITLSKIIDVPSIYQMNQSILKDYTLYCLKKKAEINIRLFEAKKDKENLENVLRNLEASEYIVNLLLNSTTEESTQLVWRKEASQAYLYGAYAAHLLGDKEKAFSFMEKNKALLLSASILKNTGFVNLPRNVSDEEIRLKKLIYNLENEFSKDKSRAVIQDSLFNVKRAHERYVDSLKIVYPKYFDRKINVSQVSLAQAREELKKDQVLISYIWNEFDKEKELLIGLATSKDTTFTFQINEVTSIKEILSGYRATISKPQTTKESRDAYQTVAFELYSMLFPTKEVKNLIKGKDLLIITDGDLQNIPFEALITRAKTSQYLVLDSDISYSYSYSFIKHNEKVSRVAEKTFVGYAPISFKEQGLSKLSSSEKEVNRIDEELGGAVKLYNEATKEDFLRYSSDAKIVHLATHADAGKKPWIAFSDKKLELHELYTYRNNADLVTLSACNTSLGEVASGEGVLSLARGFFYSGSKSVVSSLWEVNDTSTSDIMTTFYKNLKEGQNKSEALSNAKRTYLTNNSLSAQSPYYWSSFVVIGDIQAIGFAGSYWLHVVIAVGLLLLLLFFRKKRTF